MEVTRDNKFLITFGWDGNFNKISITTGQVVAQFGRLCESEWAAIRMAPDGETFFTYDSFCKLKLFRFDDGSRVKRFGSFGNQGNEIAQQMVVTRDGQS